ncbi:MAG: polysaccharide deacetylase family protein [Ignavibacteriaceae bacterium]
MKTAIYLFLIISLNITPQKRICFTFDDFPHVYIQLYNDNFMKNSMQKFIDTLLVYRVPAIAFINEIKLYNNYGFENAKIVELVRMWIDAGFEIGNHTYSHKNLNLYPAGSFKTDIFLGEKITNRILKEKNKKMTYFRFPQLETGKTAQEFKEIKEFLRKHGYETAPVTMKNEDFYFAAAYSKANKQKDPAQMKLIAQDYLSYLPKFIDYFEKQSEFLFKRQINQIMLLHVNELNIDYINEVCKVFINKGYQFITMEKALSDPVYAIEETYYGSAGIPFLESKAIKTGIFYNPHKLKLFRGTHIELPKYLKKP